MCSSDLVFFSEYEAADKCIKAEKLYTPNMDNHEKYSKIYSVYKDIASMSAPIWDTLSGIAEK